MQQSAPAAPDEVPSRDVHPWLERRFLAFARDGQPDEAYRLLRAHEGRLGGYLWAHHRVDLGGACGVEELLHDAAWKAVESVGSYAPDGRGLLFWAWRIGVNLARDRISSERTRHERERKAARPENLDGDDLARAVRARIDQLAEPHRSVLHFDLDHGGRGPAEELAQRFGVTVQTIYNWRNQARRLFQELGP